MIKIPEGYNCIASTQFRSCKAEAYSNKQGSLLLVIDEEIVFGPATEYQMATALHVLNDVADMKKLKQFS